MCSLPRDCEYLTVLSIRRALSILCFPELFERPGFPSVFLVARVSFDRTLSNLMIGARRFELLRTKYSTNVVLLYRDVEHLWPKVRFEFS